MLSFFPATMKLKVSHLHIWLPHARLLRRKQKAKTKNKTATKTIPLPPKKQNPNKQAINQPHTTSSTSQCYVPWAGTAWVFLAGNLTSKIVKSVWKHQVWFSVNALTYKESQFVSILARSRYSDDTLQKKEKISSHLTKHTLTGTKNPGCKSLDTCKLCISCSLCRFVKTSHKLNKLNKHALQKKRCKKTSQLHSPPHSKKASYAGLFLTLDLTGGTWVSHVKHWQLLHWQMQSTSRLELCADLGVELKFGDNTQNKSFLERIKITLTFRLQRDHITIKCLALRLPLQV